MGTVEYVEIEVEKLESVERLSSSVGKSSHADHKCLEQGRRFPPSSKLEEGSLCRTQVVNDEI